jgi:hypothetical protein
LKFVYYIEKLWITALDTADILTRLKERGDATKTSPVGNGKTKKRKYKSDKFT